MSDRLARALCDLAARVLPRARKEWGEAMKAELDHVDGRASGFVHARGCLVAAVKERARDFDTLFAAGLWSVALATTAFALSHILCAARGVSVLLGWNRDRFLAVLLRGDHAGTANAYLSARPYVIAFLFALGFAQLAVARFLVRANLGGFAIAAVVAAMLAAAGVAFQLSIVWMPDGVPSEFFAPLVQALAVPALLLWSNGRHALRGSE